MLNIEKLKSRLAAIPLDLDFLKTRLAEIYLRKEGEETANEVLGKIANLEREKEVLPVQIEAVENADREAQNLQQKERLEKQREAADQILKDLSGLAKRLDQSEANYYRDFLALYEAVERYAGHRRIFSQGEAFAADFFVREQRVTRDHAHNVTAVIGEPDGNRGYYHNKIIGLQASRDMARRAKDAGLMVAPALKSGKVMA